MILTIDIKDSVADKILYFLNQFKDDIKILDRDVKVDDTLDIEEIKEDDPDYKYIIEGRKEREKYPENYVAEDEIN